MADAKDAPANGTEEVKKEEKAAETSPSQRGRGGRGKLSTIFKPKRPEMLPVKGIMQPQWRGTEKIIPK